MKKSLCFVLCSVLIFPYIAFAQLELDPYEKNICQWFDNKDSEKHAISDDFMKDFKDFGESRNRKLQPIIYDKAIQVNNIAAEVASKNDKASFNARHAVVTAAHADMNEHLCNKRACRILLAAARLFSLVGGSVGTKKDLDTAKNLYRLIITTYTGVAYTSYVKEAEFGLEDLKAIKPHK